MCLHVQILREEFLKVLLRQLDQMFLTVESRFYEPPRETKIGSKYRRVREIGKITVFD